MKSLSHPIKSVKDSAVREILPGLLLSFAIAAFSRLLAI
ncbi:putative sulfate exporter family transporter, partial [Enterococcus faecalis]